MLETGMRPEEVYRIVRSRHSACTISDTGGATGAVEAGIDLVTPAAMLGHSKINMVLRYAHPTQEHQTKAMEPIEQFIAQKRIDAAARQQGMSKIAVQWELTIVPTNSPTGISAAQWQNVVKH
jgi:hypothetical protein